MKRKIWWTAVLVLLVGALTGYALTRPEPPDTRYMGAYVQRQIDWLKQHSGA